MGVRGRRRWCGGDMMTVQRVKLGGGVVKIAAKLKWRVTIPSAIFFYKLCACLCVYLCVSLSLKWAPTPSPRPGSEVTEVDAVLDED